jgi:phage shock protein A
MTQQISVEDAFPTYRQKCNELFDANLLLQAQVNVLQQQNTALQQQNESLQDQLTDTEGRLAEAESQLEQAEAHQPLTCTDPQVDALP